MFLDKYFKADSLVFLFFLFLAIIHGVSWGFADTYDHMSNVDVQTYVGLSNFDLDQHPVRRYRVIVPFLAAGVKLVLGPIFSALTPNQFPGDFPTIMSFLVVNNLLMALYGLLLFKISQHFLKKESIWPAVIGVACVLTSRWTAYLSGSALVDSLFLIALALTILGVLKQHIGLLILAIYLGPWAKESYIFFVPLLLFASRRFYPKLILHLIISGIVVFGFRYWFDQQIGASFGESIGRDVSHFQGMFDSLKRLFSFHGLYEIFSIGGAWNLFLVFAVLKKEIRNLILEKLSWMWILLAGSVLFQALLSYELARMFYLLTPLLAVCIALTFEWIFEEHYKSPVHKKAH